LTTATRGTLARHYDRRDARGVRTSQTGTQVVRVGHAVEHEQQAGRVAERLERLFELRLGVARARCDFSDRALVALAVGKSIEFVVGGAVNGDAGGGRELPQFLQSQGRLAAFGEPELTHALRVARQQRPYGVDAVGDARLRRRL
jgi:hypothetical protein